MGLFSKKECGKDYLGELAGVVISERSLIRMLQLEFKQKIVHITAEGSSFTLHFDESGPINASIMGPEDMQAFFKRYYGRAIVEVSKLSDGHEQYIVRFEG
ncbi:MAG: hypothetical protein NTU61_01445 [Candidatus Altiarchaeota archaeon]|nr:hypothetical protein [Candidatus Altiarchaeota archaeon]